MRVGQKGFTIVELLIVIVIIGVLAAITIVAYNGIVATTQESSVKNDMKSIATQVELYRAQEDRYPSSTQLQALGVEVNKQTYGVNPTGATIFYCVTTDGTAFSIVARVKSSLLLRYISTGAPVGVYSGASTAPQLCLDSGLPGSTSAVTYTAFTEDGEWYDWVR